MKQCCKETDTLEKLENEDELVYLTICFMASIRRMKGAPYKKVLLVCGHGYGLSLIHIWVVLSRKPFASGSKASWV